MMMHTKEVEAQQVPPGKDVVSFPTFVVEDENGLEIRRVEGRQSDAKALVKQLGVKSKKSSTRRRRVRARTTRRKIR
jgi:predicted thioesterase